MREVQDNLKDTIEEEVYVSHTLPRGTGTPKDRDEVNRRSRVHKEVCLLLIDKSKPKIEDLYVSVGVMKD